jgi:hypothetical protein
MNTLRRLLVLLAGISGLLTFFAGPALAYNGCDAVRSGTAATVAGCQEQHCEPLLRR